MKVTLEICHRNDIRNMTLEQLKMRIGRSLCELICHDAPYEVLSIKISGAFTVWVQLDVNTTQLNYP